MNIFRSYGLVPIPGKGVEISVPLEVQEEICRSKNTPIEDSGILFNLQYETHREIGEEEFGYFVSLEKPNLNISLGGLCLLLSVLNDMPNNVRVNDPQLIELSATKFGEMLVLSAEMNSEFFSWCAGNLQEFSVDSGDIRMSSAKMMDKISPSQLGANNPERFACSANKKSLALGLSGRNFCATFLPERGEPARLDTHNDRGYPSLAPLLLFQMALIEDMYRDQEDYDVIAT